MLFPVELLVCPPRGVPFPNISTKMVFESYKGDMGILAGSECVNSNEFGNKLLICRVTNNFHW